MGLSLFGRTWKVRVDTLDVSAIDLDFKILRSIKSVPNKCVLTLWNLSPDHRAQLLRRNRPNPTQNKLYGIPVQIEAGYQQETSVLFSGDLREVLSVREGSDWKTTLSGEDGGRSYREGRINQTFATGTPIGTVLSACASALGIGLGNTADFTSGAEIAGIGSTLPHAMTLSGSAAKELDRVTASIGLTWSAQGGNLQLLKKGKPLDLGAIKLSSNTGLLDSPEASIDASVSLPTPKVEINAAGVINATATLKTTQKPTRKTADPSILKLRTLLIPGLVPGRQIVLDSSAFQGSYRITEVEYVGQTWSKSWYAQMVARLIS